MLPWKKEVWGSILYKKHRTPFGLLTYQIYVYNINFLLFKKKKIVMVIFVFYGYIAL